MKKLRIKQLALALGTTATVAAPVAAVVSCDSSKSVFFQGRRTVVSYSPESSFTGEATRAWDMSVQPSNMLSRDIFDMTTTTLIKQNVVQSSKVVEDKAGVVSEEHPKIEEWDLNGADSISIAPDGTNYTKFTSVKDAFSAINSTGVKSFKFTVPKGIKYVNSKGEETKYNYKAIDYFYGFMRTIYTIEEVREKSSIQGVATGLPAIEDEYKQKMLSDYEWYPGGELDAENFENGNAYLFNLFGVDLHATVLANTGPSHSDDEFIIKLKTNVTNTAFAESILGSSNEVTPVPAEKIRELNNLDTKSEFTEPGKFLQLLEYGKAKRTNNVADLSGLLSVGMYYFKQYDTRSVKDGGTGIVVVKNPHGANIKYAADDRTLEQYIILVNGTGDQDTFNQARQRSFLKDNSESILYTQVKQSIALMDPIRNHKYTQQYVTSKTGAVAQGLMNPYYMLNGAMKLDDNTSKLLFGDTTKGALTNPKSDDQYFFGRGRTFRALLNSSTNLFTLSKLYTPSSTLSKTARDYEPNQPVAVGGKDTFGDDPMLGTPINSISDQTASNWYAAHSDGDKNIALKPTDNQYTKAQAGWKKFLTDARVELGMSQTDKFTFPLYDYRASDVKETSTTTAAWKTLVKYLNTLTAGDNIEFVEFDKNSGDKSTNIINKVRTAPFLYSGAGADYGSVSSIVQQYVSASYGFSMGAQLLVKTLENGADKTKDLGEDYVTKEVDFSDLWTFINANGHILKESDIKQKLESITMNDWVDYKGSTLKGEKNDMLNEIDNIMQKYFLSIAGDKEKILRWTKFVSNTNMGDKLAMGYSSYTSSTTPITGTLPVGTVYAQPWVHMAQIPSSSDVQDNMVDVRIDVK